MPGLNLARAVVFMRRTGWLLCLMTPVVFGFEVAGAENSRAAAASQPSTGPGILAANSSLVERPDPKMRLLVGRSISVKTQQRLRRIYISDPNVLDSTIIDSREVVLTAKIPGRTSLMLWDESGQHQIYSVSSDIDTTGLKDALQKALPGEAIEVEAQETHIVLSGTVSSVAVAEAALKIANSYSKDVTSTLRVTLSHPKQVKLKVRIVEMDRSKLNQFGLNFFAPQGNNLASVSTQQFPTTATSGGASSAGSGGLTISDPLNLFLYNQNLNVGVTIKDLEQKQVLQILAEPTITAMSGEKASFLSGGEFPFPVVQGGTGGFTSVTIQFRPFGVKLDFTPIVNADDSIQLKVSPEVSALDYTNAVTISGYTIPALSTRKADTQVELKDGQSFAISGLLDHRTTEILSKVPGIAEIPILGQLFRSKSVNRSVAELVVIVTPTIVDPLEKAPVPSEPGMVIPFLENDKFDSSVQPKSGSAVSR